MLNKTREEENLWG